MLQEHHSPTVFLSQRCARPPLYPKPGAGITVSHMTLNVQDVTLSTCINHTDGWNTAPLVPFLSGRVVPGAYESLGALRTYGGSWIK